MHDPWNCAKLKFRNKKVVMEISKLMRRFSRRHNAAGYCKSVVKTLFYTSLDEYDVQGGSCDQFLHLKRKQCVMFGWRGKGNIFNK